MLYNVAIVYDPLFRSLYPILKLQSFATLLQNCKPLDTLGNKRIGFVLFLKQTTLEIFILVIVRHLLKRWCVYSMQNVIRFSNTAVLK